MTKNLCKSVRCFKDDTKVVATASEHDPSVREHAAQKPSKNIVKQSGAPRMRKSRRKRDVKKPSKKNEPDSKEVDHELKLSEESSED